MLAISVSHVVYFLITVVISNAWLCVCGGLVAPDPPSRCFWDIVLCGSLGAVGRSWNSALQCREICEKRETHEWECVINGCFTVKCVRYLSREVWVYQSSDGTRMDQLCDSVTHPIRWAADYRPTQLMRSRSQMPFSHFLHSLTLLFCSLFPRWEHTFKHAAASHTHVWYQYKTDTVCWPVIIWTAACTGVLSMSFHSTGPLTLPPNPQPPGKILKKWLTKLVKAK